MVNFCINKEEVNKNTLLASVRLCLIPKGFKIIKKKLQFYLIFLSAPCQQWDIYFAIHNSYVQT